MPKTLILCDCMGSQSIDRDAIEKTCGLSCSKVHTSLCMDQIEQAAGLIANCDAIIACKQEQQRFEELAEEIEAPVPAFLDIRDRAGWTNDKATTAPKMAALVAEAMLPASGQKTLDVISEGMCLILGDTDAALAAAEDLKSSLNVTLLLSEPQDVALDSDYDVVVGRFKRANGALGCFDIVIDAFQDPIRGGRGAVQWSSPKNGAKTQCDLILDLSGGDALFPAPQKREGYLKADPKSSGEVAKAVLEASQMVGTFEKPLYLVSEPLLCAHSRAEQTGCSKCVNVCPTGAISPDGDHVTIDPMICAGCGACAALCPSGSITYDAPAPSLIFKRIQTLAESFKSAGGESPRLLVHDDNFGLELIQLSSRFGEGLPADVIPFETSSLAAFGHAEMLAALGAGFVSVDILSSPTSDLETIKAEQILANAISEKVTVLEIVDPDDLSENLTEKQKGSVNSSTILPIGSRRQVARLAAKSLNPDTEVLALPSGAPYGAVVMDTNACTLCLSCVSLCPSGALNDNPDKPQLLFQEDACLQCGICATICPETAITLEPRLDLTDAALSQRVVHEEEPFACIECGALFGVKSTVEKITEKLAGNHSMFESSDAAKMIQMCDNCRVNAQFKSKDNPFQGGEKPRVRTTEDYYSKRRDH